MDLMKEYSKKLCSWLLIIAMTFLTIGIQGILPQPVLADSGPLSQSLTKTLNYYKVNNYSNAASWWDMAGLWGSGDSTKTNWDSSKTSLYGNILGSLAKGENPSALLTELKATQDSSTGAFPGSFGPTSNDQIWAMVALDTGNTSYDQDKAVVNLLTYQNADGGFFYSTAYNTSDPDTTGMALLALANHQTAAGVTDAINKAETYLKGVQQDSGGFASWGTDNPNSVAAVISGLVAAGADPLSVGWQKNGKTMLDDLLSFQLADGSFNSPYNPGQADPMATYQSLVALGDLNANKSVWQRLQEQSPQETGGDSIISPLTAEFDKNSAKQADIPVAITLNGNTLIKICNKDTVLANGSDYTVADEGRKIIIKKSYLAEQKTGTTTLDFIFSAGNPGTLSITVADSSSGGVVVEQGNIKLSVYGKNKEVILAPTTVTVESGATPYSVLVDQLGEANVTVDDFYVSGIEGLNAGDDGSLSGWMYSVNGDYPQVSALTKKLSDGDVVVWRYTTNMGKDIGADMSTDPGPAAGGPGTVAGDQDQINQETLDELNNVTAEQQAAAGLPEDTSLVSPESAGQVVLKTADGVQITVPTGAIRGQSNPVKFIVEIGKITTPPEADRTVRVLSPLKYQRRFYIENPAGAGQEDSVQFSAPIILSFPIVTEDLPSGIDVQQLAFYWWDPAKNDWVKLGGIFDQVTKTISLPVYYSSTYAVMADIAGAPKRLAGPDRFQTANTVACQGWKAGSDNIVLVNAYTFSDALAAAPLAYKLNAPILLTEANTLTSSTLEQIKKLKPKKITLIGGTGVISQAIQNNLGKTYGTDNVLRCGGSDRYDTAALIAAALGTNGKAIIANGGEDHYTDALAIAGYAAYNGIPILFTEEEVLPDSTIRALTAQKVTSTIAVGGSSVIPEKITKLLPEAVRYSGSDRYATAVAVAEGLKLNVNQVYVVTGLNFADALTAGNLAAHTMSPVIMVDNTIPEVSSGYLTAHKEAISDLVIVGGEGVINTEQENKLRAICH
jgi:putative cell wall-binding protein